LEKKEVIELTLLNTVSPYQRDTQNWYMNFLQEKEKSLISQLPCKRIKTQKKIFYCEQEKIKYPFVYVILNNCTVICPLRKYLDFGKHQNMNTYFRNKVFV
jgi:hypothetical protein